jgi:hypothetical protein
MALAFPTTNPGKLHVPGLEMLVMPEMGGSQYTLATIDAPSEGIVLGIGTGIKPHLDEGLTDTDSQYFLPQTTVVFNAAIPLFDSNFSPQTTTFVCRLAVFSNSPRAPPTLTAFVL